MLGSRLTPSVVGLDDDGQVLVGQAAKERLITHPGLTAAVFKRLMGTDRLTQLGSRSFRAEELSSFVLRSLKADAEALLGEPVNEAVISVPAYFRDAQRKATRAAGELAGLKVERLVNEPTAAAMAYGLHEAKNETTFLVFDLGGGTFDVSVVELFDGVMEVHASAGDSFLGGEDFTAALATGFLEHAGVADDALEPGERSRLWKQAELAKLRLTAADQAEIKLSLKEREIAWTATRALFEGRTRELVERMRRPVERAMRDAKLSLGDLDSVVLVGGATRMPLVRVARREALRPVPAHPDPPRRGRGARSGDPGGAQEPRQGALRGGADRHVAPTRSASTSPSATNGASRVGREFSPIIERNTVIPTSREQSYSPTHEHQREVRFDVYQGESRRLENNVKLGRADAAAAARQRPRGELAWCASPTTSTACSRSTRRSPAHRCGAAS